MGARKLHCDFSKHCQREGRFYLINGVQRPICDEHAEGLKKHAQVFKVPDGKEGGA